MAKAYSVDLRERVVRHVKAGQSCHAAARHFGVSVSFVVKLMQAYGLSGRLEARPSGGKRHSKLDPHRAFIVAQVSGQDDITMPELAAALSSAKGVSVDPASLSRWLIRNGYRFKKNAGGQRARSGRHPHGARRMDTKAPTKNAARAPSARLSR